MTAAPLRSTVPLCHRSGRPPAHAQPGYRRIPEHGDEKRPRPLLSTPEIHSPVRCDIWVSIAGRIVRPDARKRAARGIFRLRQIDAEAAPPGFRRAAPPASLDLQKMRREVDLRGA